MRDPLYVPGVSRAALVFDLVLAGFFGVIGTPVMWEQNSRFSGLITLLIAVAILLRHIAPTAMIMLALGTATAQVIDTQIAMLGVLGYAPLFAIVGAHPHRAVRRGSLAVAIVGVFVAAAVTPVAFPDGDSRVFVFVLGLAGASVVVLGGWTFGFTRFQRQSMEQARVDETIAELERRRLLDLYAEQTQRSRLARDMHDVVAHSLAVVIAQAEGARFAMSTSPDAADRALTVIAGTAREALSDVRAVLDQLRDNDTAAQSSAADREQLFERMRAAGMRLDTEEHGDPENVDPAVVRTAHRILIEALTNALKYGDLTAPVRVVHDWRDDARMVVRNAIAEHPLSPGGAGHGIVGMSERAGAVGGRLRSGPDETDWMLTFIVPANGKTPPKEAP